MNSLIAFIMLQQFLLNFLCYECHLQGGKSYKEYILYTISSYMNACTIKLKLTVKKIKRLF